MSSFALRLRPLLFALFGVYLFLYPGSLTLVALDRVPVWGVWMGGGLLILQGLLMGTWLAANYGRWGVAASLLALVGSWAVEHIGATTGFPFGLYTYTNVLQPQIIGVVPLAIPFAWLLIVTAAIGTSEHVLRRNGRVGAGDARVTPVKVLTAASFALLLDVSIEPFAVHINQYWVWNGGMASSYNGYYGIPVSNFVAWWVTSLLLVWGTLWLRRTAEQQRIRRSTGSTPRPMLFATLPFTLYLMNLVMFVLVNLARGQEVAALIGVCILLFLGFDWSVPLMMRRVLGTAQEKKQL